MKKIFIGFVFLLTCAASFAQRTPDLPLYTGSGIDSALFNGYIGNHNRGIYGIDIGRSRTDSLVSALAAIGVTVGQKAPIASPTLTGLVTAPRLSLTGSVNSNHLQAEGLGLYWSDFYNPTVPSLSILSDNARFVEGINPQAVIDGHSSWLQMNSGSFNFYSAGDSQHSAGADLGDDQQSLMLLSPQTISLYNGKAEVSPSGNLNIDGELTTQDGSLTSQMAGKLSISDTAAMFAAHPGGGTVDATPTDGSTNAVQSNGVYDALAGKLSISDTSTAFGDYRTALNARATTSDLTAHTSNTSNPHSVTKSQVGLGNVDNTSDANKPVSNATKDSLNEKQYDLKIINVQKAGATGNGSTDDADAINAAITSATNVKLHFPAGTYLVSEPITKSSGKLIITADKDAIIKIAPAFPAQATVRDGVFDFEEMDGIEISGLTIDGNRSNLTNAGTDWTNFIMGFSFYKCKNVTLTDCNIYNAPSNPYQFQNDTNVVIQNCKASDFWGNAQTFQYCYNVRSQGNNIKGRGNEGMSAPSGVGIIGIAGQYHKYINNHVDSTSDTGIKTEGTNDVDILWNYVGHSSKDGIKFENLHDNEVGQPQIDTVYRAKISHNTVDQILKGKLDGSCLLQVYGGRDVVIDNNILIGGAKDTLEDGIQIDQNSDLSGMVSANIVVSNNTIRNANRFLYVNFAQNVNVINNVCENAVAPLADYNGVVLTGSSRLTIKNNVFKRNGTGSINGFAVSIFQCPEIIFSHNSVINGFKGLAATFNSSQNIDLSNNIWDNFGNYFASIAFSSAITIGTLNLSRNTISRVADASWAFKITPTNGTINSIDLSGTKINGVTGNSNYGLEIPSGGTVSRTNIRDFVVSGDLVFPAISALAGAGKIISSTTRKVTATSSATPTVNTDQTDFFELTAQAADITSFTTNLTGTPSSDDVLHIAITGTASRAITWGSKFEASTIALPTTTSGTSRLDVYFVWNSTTSKWRVGGVW